MMTTSEILAVVDNVIRLKRDTLGPELLSELRNRLTRENPQYHVMRRMRDRNPQKYQHTKLPAATVTSYEEDEQTFYVPRGFIGELKLMIAEHGMTIRIINNTIIFPRNVDIQLSDDLELKEYQKKGVGSLVLSSNGVLVAPCGGGKTVAGVAILTTLKQPTLVLVHTNDLMSQWQRELASKAVLPCPVGQWGGGIKQRELVTVATIQTLIKMSQPDLAELLSHFGCVILDEAHHCPANTFLQVMNQCASRYRFGLTATPNRKDGLEFLMFDTIGPIQSRITQDELKAEGRSQLCSVRNHHTTFFTRHTADEWTSLLAELTTDADRNRIIVDNVLADWNAGEFPLILSQRVAHCKSLLRALQSHGMHVELLVGEVPKIARDQICDRARRGLVDAIVATKVADEGLDIPNLSSVHLTTPSANEAKLEQQIGRIRRPIEGKNSIVHDYIDARVSGLVRMAQSRRRFYKRWEFTFEG